MPKFIPRVRKHKVLARQKQHHQPSQNDDANVTEILPAEQREREEKKKAMREDLIRQSEGKISQKKKKRMDKYIDNKLKKEENLELLKKLASHKVDTSLFQSSKKLGTGVDTKREQLKRANLERRAGVDVERNEGLLFEPRKMGVYEEPSEEEEEEDELGTQANFAAKSNNASVAKSAPRKQERLSPSPPIARPVESTSLDEAKSANVTLQNIGKFGGGLKRPLELDESGRPVIQTRKRQKKSKPLVVQEAPDWEGFSSADDGSGPGTEDEEDDEESISQASEDNDIGSEGADDDSTSDSVASGSSDDESSDSSSGENSKVARKERTSAFKAWATQQRNDAIGFTPTNNLTYAIPAKPANFQPRPLESDPLPRELETKTATDATRKAFSVAVERSQEMQEARLQLPIVAEEQKIMEAIHNNDVVVIGGATGSGKTTQVPQFLYEAGYGAPDGPTPGLIGITQPRRVAAVSMSKRVGDELGNAGSKVAYQIRFDTSTSAKTAIKFMTDGVLLREISQDFVLSKYSAIVIDEAHERSVNTDILIGMLSRIVELRAKMAKQDPKNKALKLIIMSATLEMSEFTKNERLFRHGPPPLLTAEGRQYTVTNHFSKHTKRDYVDEAFRKISRGHRKLPQGGMLVFLTGQNEIMQLAKKLKETFSTTSNPDVKTGKVQISPAEIPLETEDIDIGSKERNEEDDDGSDSDDSVIRGLDNDDDTDDEEEEGEFDIQEEAAEQTVMKVHVLPLYSQLPTNQQLRVFEPPPDGSRLIVLATNVAETSLTIPGIRYVFDCGRAKEKNFDRDTGVQSFEIGWISKASANQRSGRAGRTGPGHCYRLYSSAVYESHFEQHATPEIQRTLLEGVVLQLKSMGAPVASFPFPTSPDRESLRRAENLLTYLGALSADGKVTDLGRELSLYPLSPRYARMLVKGMAQNLTAYTIALVAALSVPELIIPENKLGLREPVVDPDAIRTEADNLEAEERSRLRKAYNKSQSKLALNAKQSDCIKVTVAVCSYAYQSDPQAFCEDMFLNSKAMHEASRLRQQLSHIIHAHHPQAMGAYAAKLPGATEEVYARLMGICASGFIDQIAMRADLAPVPPELARKPKTAIDVPYVTLFASQTGRPSSDDPSEKYVYLHPSSLLARTPVKNMPGWIIYSHLQRATPSTVLGSKTPKTRFHPLTTVSRRDIVNIALGTPLLQISKPQGKIVDIERREKGEPERRECEVELSLVGEKGSQGWGMGVRKVIQRRNQAGKPWSIEKMLS